MNRLEITLGRLTRALKENDMGAAAHYARDLIDCFPVPVDILQQLNLPPEPMYEVAIPTGQGGFREFFAVLALYLDPKSEEWRKGTQRK